MNKIKFLSVFFLLLLNPIFTPEQTKEVKKTESFFLTRYKYNNRIGLKNKGLSFNGDSSLPTLTNPETESLAQTLFEHYLKKQPVLTFPNDLSLKQAETIQKKLVKLLIPSQGQLIGYKAGLTNQKIQEKFKVSQPVLGRILKQMILPSGVTLPPNFAAIPRLEGDLIVRVKSEGINQAKTPQEILKNLDAIIPFLELPDLVYTKDLELNGAMLVAVNVGARLGIVGTPILLQSTEKWQNKLNNIQVIIVDQSGQELAQGHSKNLLGDPLKVVLWIKDKLHSQGKSLKKGDLLSLGSITPVIPIKPGTTIYGQYLGLNPDKKIEISVNFKN
ncbi:2-keto-4-pentenoate hydratase [Aphanothece sacrum]|uniref:2-oxo-hepta-3-ene-1,7-dioic acid hydratase n=1 Tax=Aphanothece sacrum FPU1 TaxID=1920663 RepID=A0A401INQ8_APHSA|nr:hydratase [Aphanothece sacrum]GBF82910.1 2-oxo-hepta-3-ene-1,7-dioic acid hydratase [Aphanothece sacrum FPU1]